MGLGQGYMVHTYIIFRGSVRIGIAIMLNGGWNMEHGTHASVRCDRQTGLMKESVRHGVVSKARGLTRPLNADR